MVARRKYCVCLELVVTLRKKGAMEFLIVQTTGNLRMRLSGWFNCSDSLVLIVLIVYSDEKNCSLDLCSVEHGK